jgi:DNA-directed RNA polymerase subunit RPC12/RpoP
MSRAEIVILSIKVLGIVSYECAHCGELDLTRQELFQHLKVQHGIQQPREEDAYTYQDRLYECVDCVHKVNGKYYTFQTNCEQELFEHLLYEHNLSVDEANEVVYELKEHDIDELCYLRDENNYWYN